MGVQGGRPPAMNIVVLVKQVRDTATDPKLNAEDKTLDREASDGVINELDEYAIEEALLLKEKHGGEVTVLTMGPDQASDSIRKALSTGEIGRAACRERERYLRPRLPLETRDRMATTARAAAGENAPTNQPTR